MTPARGDVFTHHSILDPGWLPGPGQRMTDAPKAVMVISRVTRTTVYYKYADRIVKGAAFQMGREFYDRIYTPQEQTP